MPETRPDPSGRYSPLCRHDRHTALHAELQTARARLDGLRELRRAYRRHRHELCAAAGGTPAWWPFASRRTTNTRYAVRRVEAALQEVNDQVDELEKLVEKLAGRVTEAAAALD